MKYKKKPISVILRSNKTIFTFNDISLLWGDCEQKTIISGVNYYVKSGELYRIRRGIYSKDKNYNQLELATRIFTPSYLSFETVLALNGINFQYSSKVMVATYQTREITVDNQIYSYKKIKNLVLTDSSGVEHKDDIAMASPERAFLDTIYIHKDYHFDNLGTLNWDKVFDILPIYKNKRMAKKVLEFYEFYKTTL